MKNQYYKKDKRAEIYKESRHTNEYGDTISGYKPISAAPLWCYTKQLTQDQIYKAMAVSSAETRLFVFNYRKDIEVLDSIKYKDKWYSITRVDTQNDYNTDIFVYVEEGYTPEDYEILPYSDN